MKESKVQNSLHAEEGPSANNQNDARVIEQIARTRGRELRGFIFKYLKDSNLAEELAQESFERLIRRMSKPGVIDAPAYLFRTASNIACDQIRRQKIGPIDTDVSLDELEISSNEPTPEDMLQYDDLRHAWAKAMSELPDLHREVFYLRRFEGLSTQEIAEQCGITQRSVQRYIAATLKYLHERTGWNI